MKVLIMAQSKEVEYKGLSPKVFVAGLLLVTAVTLYYGILVGGTAEHRFNPPYSDWAAKVMQNNVPTVTLQDRFVVRNAQAFPLTMGLFIIINILSAYILKVQGRKGISPSILTILAMVSASFIFNINNGTGLWWNNCTGWNVIGLSMYYQRGAPELWALVPPLMAPNDPAAYEAIVPVSTWAIHPAFYSTIAWNILLFSSQTMVFVCLSMILKVLWFDVESIPTVWTDVQIQSIRLVSEASPETGSETSRSRKWFIVGFLLQAILTLLTYSYGVINDVLNGPQAAFMTDYQGYLLNTNIQLAPVQDFATLGVLPWVSLFISLHPYQIGFAYMLPLDILYSALLGYLIFRLVIPVAFTSAGFLPPFLGDRTRNIQARLMADRFVGAPWATGLYSATSLGLLAALALYPFIRYRERILPMLKAMYSKVDKSLEDLSPMPLRFVWVGLFGSLMVWLGCWAAVGANMTVVTITIIVQGLMVIGATRAGMYTAGVNFFNEMISGGDNFRPPFYMPGHLAASYLAPNPTPSPGSVATWYATIAPQRYIGWMNTQSLVLGHSLYSLKIGEEFKIKRRDNGLALVLAFTAITVFSTIAYVLQAHVWPWKLGGPLGQICDVSERDTLSSLLTNFRRGSWYGISDPVPTLLGIGSAGIIQYLVYVALGFALVPLMLLVRSRVPQFRLLPEGIALGAFLTGESWAIPVFFVGMVLRVITYKAGLVSAYRSKLQPLCMGLIVGFFVPMSILHLVQMFYNIPANWFWKLSRA